MNMVFCPDDSEIFLFCGTWADIFRMGDGTSMDSGAAKSAAVADLCIIRLLKTDRLKDVSKFRLMARALVASSEISLTEVCLRKTDGK